MQQRRDELNLLLHALGKLLGLLSSASEISMRLAQPWRACAHLPRQAMQLAKEDKLIEDLHLLVEAALFGQIAHAIQALALKRLSKQIDTARIGHA